MATQINDPTVQLDPATGEVQSVTLTGHVDCTPLRVTITTVSAGSFSGIASVDSGGTFTVTFTAGDDFVPGDIACDDTIGVKLECRDANNVWKEQGTAQPKIKCGEGCALTIDSVDSQEADDGSGQPSVIAVTGTAAHCDSVDVIVSTSSGNAGRTVPVQSGAWSVTFRDGVDGASLKGFECGADVHVHAQCKGDRGCFADLDVELDCDPACPDVDVHVQSPTVSVDDPGTGDLVCVDPGRYVITVTSPAAADIESCEWRRENEVLTNQSPGTQIAQSGRQLTVDLPADVNATFLVTVHMTNGCVVPRTVTFACGNGKPGDETPPGGPGGDGNNDNGNGNNGGGGGGGGGQVCGPCCIWFIVNVFAVFATLVAFVIAGCVFQWVEPISLSIAIGLALATIASLIAWAIFCARSGEVSCQQILRLKDIVRWLQLLAVFLAFLFAAGGDLPCAMAFLVDTGFLAVVQEILTWTSRAAGCEPNPWWTMPRARRRRR
jgi:hypothetical protein